MKKMNKLVALLLAAVMVLGMLPTTTAHAHENHTHAVELHGIEEYPAIVPDTATDVNIDEAGYIAYFTFTPEVTDLYYFYSSSLGSGYTDTYGHLYDENMVELTSNDDANYGNGAGASAPNFCIEYVMEAGVTYVLSARLYSSYSTGSFTVTLATGHEYTSEVTKAASCSGDGIRTHTCKHCGASYEEIIPAAHEYGDDGCCIHCGEAYLITGECGDDLTWSLDWFGNLNITGTGDMYNFIVGYGDSYPAPWYDYRNDITKVTVEEGVTTIGNYAFQNCQNIASVTLPESLTALGVSAFSSCYGLTEITLPDAITTIPDSCFKYCGELSEIDWPASLTTIESNAFHSCNLPDLVLPEGITSIGQYAFSSSSNLRKLTLPTTLTDVANYAFASMYNTLDFVFTGDAPTFGGNQVFSYAYANVWYPLGNPTWTEEVRKNYGGSITWLGVCSGEHTFGDAVTVPATCEVGEYLTMTCTVCGYIEVSPEMSDPLGHDLIETVIEPDCANWQYGRTEITCTRCDYYDSKDWVPYEHAYEATVTEATCTTDGYTTYTCSVCGEYYNDNYISAPGHAVENWSEVTEATCTEDGVKTGACANCGETVTEVVTAALGHEWDEENGTSNDDGSVTYSCIRCDATYTTEGTSLRLGDNQFTVEGYAGTVTKTFTAEQTGTLTITLNNAVYHNAYAYDNGWTDLYWQNLGLQWVFDQGFFNIYVNGTNTDYTAISEAEIVLDTIEVTAGDVVEVEVNHSESSDYYHNDVQFNMNLALESAEPEVLELVLGDNIFELPESLTGEGATGTWTAEADGTLTIDVTSIYYHDPINMEFFGEEWTEMPLDRAFAYEWFDLYINGEKNVDGSATVEVAAGDEVTIKIGNYYGYLTKATVNLSFAEPALELVLGDNIFELPESLTGEGATGTWTAETDGTLTIDVTSIYYHDPINMEFFGEEWTEMPIDRAFAYEWFDLLVNGEKDSDGSATVEVAAGDEVTIKVGNYYGYLTKATVNLSFAEPHVHAYTAVVTEPTCTEGGYTTYTCECGDSYVADETEALGHTEEVIPAVDPTCTETGLTEGKKCSVCGEILVAQEVVPALGHVWNGLNCENCDATRENPFSDVSAQHHSAFLNAILWANEEGITTGTGDGTTFDPNGKCQRASVVTFLWRAAGCPEPTTTENPFEDVKESDFFYKAVLWAVEEGITNGTSAKEFSPYAECNRAVVVTFLWRAMNEPASEAEVTFSDVADGQFYSTAVAWAVEHGITNGMGDGTFGVNVTCNRAQVVTFLYRTYNN